MKSGLSPQHFKKSIRPQDDLFRFANGTWLDETEIPADRAWWGAPVELRELSEHFVLTLGGDPHARVLHFQPEHAHCIGANLRR